VYKGLVDFTASMKGSLSQGRAGGRLNIAGMSVRNRQTLLQVDGLRCDYPFEVVFSPDVAADSLLVAGKEEIIANEFFSREANVSVASVRAAHPTRGTSFEYVRDLSALATMEDNVFRLSDLRARVMDGALYGRLIAVNLGGLDLGGSSLKTLPERLEYRLAMDITNINIALLDDPGSAHKKAGAELSLNASVLGRGVTMTREISATGHVNIHKIGKKFANRLMKGLSTEQGKSKLGGSAQWVMDNFMRVRGFNFTLDRGLVYATVPLKPGPFGFIAGVENNMVSFDRLPIQEYLKKISREE
jgi:hypothetical protein